jgi:hypothetical protein
MSEISTDINGTEPDTSRSTSGNPSMAANGSQPIAGVAALVACPVNRVLGLLATLDADSLDGIHVDFIAAGGVQVCLHEHTLDEVEELVERLGVPAVADYARLLRGGFWAVRWGADACLDGLLTVVWFTDGDSVAAMADPPQLVLP